MTPRVPSDYIGLWRRRGIWRSDGSSDLSTAVWWCQSASYHLDLRVPRERPHAADARALAAFDRAGQAAFGAQLAFAGTTVVDGKHCLWQPEIAFPYVSAIADAAWMRFDGPGQLYEEGIDASYHETWERVDANPVCAARLQGEDGELAYLLVSDAWLGFARGRPADCYPGNGPWTQFCIAEAIQGRWQTLASNLPWQEGRSIGQLATLSRTQLAMLVTGASLQVDGASWSVRDIDARN